MSRGRQDPRSRVKKAGNLRYSSEVLKCCQVPEDWPKNRPSARLPAVLCNQGAPIMRRTADRPDDVTDGDPRRTLTLVGLGYLGLVFLAVYVDYKMKMRRARKREEAKKDGEGGAGKCP